jgi:predicted ATP-binding protein involved in virulence
MKLDFSSLIVTFDNNQKTVLKKEKNEITIDDLKLPFFSKERQEYSRFIQRRPWIQQVQGGFIDRRTDEFFAEDEAFVRMYLDDNRYFEHYENKSEYKTMLKLKEKLEQIKEWCGEVRFISDQRLIRTGSKRSEEPQVIEVIRTLPQRLKAQISEVTEEYSRVANKLDSSYPRRLFAAEDGIKNQAEYQARLDEANEKFEKLNKYDLVDFSIIDEKNYNPKYSTALQIYFDDFAEKYKVFQNLVSKLDLFTKIINSRLLFKHIKITRNNGFEIVDNDDSTKVLQLSQLSSGEKQEIVLFYDLIFDTREKLLLLIDEPEISLHITWQKKFLDDLLEASKRIELQVIVATHSPQIVSNHLDIQIDLGELYGEELNTI